jgi:iron(III) transport system ATP-binding protein
MTAIEVANLVHEYTSRRTTSRAVDDVSFTVGENRFYTLLGPSGCGKTTTLRCIAGLERPTGGDIRVDDVAVVGRGVFVPPNKRNIGMVFQDYAVWPHMTVFENVALPLRVAKQLSKPEIRERVTSTLALMGMEDYIDRPATHLSGGQQQRLSLARALVRDPKLLLLDEPLSNLDAKLRDQLRTELRLIQRTLKVSTLFVTHDQVEALSLSNTIAVMHQGKIVQQGSPREIYLTPRSEVVASFVGSAAFLQGSVGGQADDGSTCVDTVIGQMRCLPDDPLAPGSAVTMAVRPEWMQISTDPVPGRNNFVGEIQMAVFAGEAVDYHLTVEGIELRVKGDQRSRFRRGESVNVSIRPEDCIAIRRDTLESAPADPALTMAATS